MKGSKEEATKARDPRVPTEPQIPWWGYLIVALAIAVVIVVGLLVWHIIALLPADSLRFTD